MSSSILPQAAGYGVVVSALERRYRRCQSARKRHRNCQLTIWPVDRDGSFLLRPHGWDHKGPDAVHLAQDLFRGRVQLCQSKVSGPVDPWTRGPVDPCFPEPQSHSGAAIPYRVAWVTRDQTVDETQRPSRPDRRWYRQCLDMGRDTAPIECHRVSLAQLTTEWDVLLKPWSGTSSESVVLGGTLRARRSRVSERASTEAISSPQSLC
jgi:hypothetical protein